MLIFRLKLICQPKKIYNQKHSTHQEMCTEISRIRMNPDSGYEVERTAMSVRGQMREQEENLSESHLMRGHHIVDYKATREGDVHMGLIEKERQSLEQR